MIAHRAHADVQARGCAVLADRDFFACGQLSFDNTGGAAFGLVGIAMRMHGGHAGVQQNGCDALACLLTFVGTRLSKNDTELLVTAIGIAMDVHRDNACLQQHACAALCKLPPPDACDHRIIDALLDALHDHGSHADVQEYSLQAMAHFARALCDREAARAEGALDVAAAALSMHAAQPRVLEHACMAVHCMGGFTPHGSRAALDAGALDGVLSALTENAADVSVQREACRALAAATRCAAALRSALDGGALEMVLVAMHDHAMDVELQAHGCNALLLLCAQERGRRSGVSLGALEAAVTAMRLPRTYRAADAGMHTNIQRFASLLLFVLLAEGDTAAVVRAGDAGAVDAVLAVLHAHASDANLALHACDVLHILMAGGAKNCNSALRAGAFTAPMFGCRRLALRWWRRWSCTRRRQPPLPLRGCLHPKRRRRRSVRRRQRSALPKRSATAAALLAVLVAQAPPLVTLTLKLWWRRSRAEAQAWRRLMPLAMCLLQRQLKQTRTSRLMWLWP